MESTTYLKNLRVSPKKLRTFLPGIKKLSPMKGAESLFYAPEKAAKMLYKGLKSAISNAKNTLKVPEDLLEWKLLTIEEGQKLKRYRPGSRGNVRPYKIRFSHLKMILKARTPKETISKKEEKKEKPRVKVSVTNTKSQITNKQSTSKPK